MCILQWLASCFIFLYAFNFSLFHLFICFKFFLVSSFYMLLIFPCFVFLYAFEIFSQTYSHFLLSEHFSIDFMVFPCAQAHEGHLKEKCHEILLHIFYHPSSPKEQQIFENTSWKHLEQMFYSSKEQKNFDRFGSVFCAHRIWTPIPKRPIANRDNLDSVIFELRILENPIKHVFTTWMLVLGVNRWVSGVSESTRLPNRRYPWTPRNRVFDPDVLFWTVLTESSIKIWESS